jgi:hypothetical protein
VCGCRKARGKDVEAANAFHRLHSHALIQFLLCHLPATPSAATTTPAAATASAATAATAATLKRPISAATASAATEATASAATIATTTHACNGDPVRANCNQNRRVRQ